MANLTADDWIWLPTSQMDEIVQFNNSSIWPWLHITPEQFPEAIYRLHLINELEKYSKMVPFLICPLGIVGSLCSIIAFWRKAYKKRKSFYIWMIFIALFDFAFCVLCPPVFVGYWTGFTGGNVYRYSKSTMQAMQILYGLLFAYSLTSDLCTLGLTIERFFGICRPIENANLSTFKRSCWTYLGCSIALICVMARFVRYAFQIMPDVDPSDPTMYKYQNTRLSQTVFFTALSQFTDLLLPFLLLIPMVYLSFRIGMAVMKRRQARRRGSLETQQQLKSQQRSAAMLRLLVILVLLFVLNQIGYVLYAISYACVNIKTIEYSNSYEDLMEYINYNLFFGSAMIVCNTAECLSRSLNFYLYYCFSESSRKQFRRAINMTLGNTI